MRILEVEHYAKQFNIHHLGRKIEAFDDLTFSLKQGQFLLVSGTNGSGKSTLLRCLYRTYLPTGGRALYHSLHGLIDLARAADIDIALLRQEEIGFVTQFLRPRPRVSAIELVAEPLLATGMALNEAEGEAGELLESFGLKPELWKAYPTTFSGGEQQKVNLARALIHPRRLLLLDEPTASLDAQTRAALVGRLAWLKEQDVAMIGVFHHPGDVRELVDTELALGNKTGVAGYPKVEEVYVVE
ncbi:MAG: ATP-binding cassette domain-containing protein [Anaerolineae bacterium]|nr:ATP-binding cassette domain-containing protein [Anaerolineae bacterium]